MSQQDNIAATEQFGKTVNSGQLEGLHAVMAPEVVDHDPAPDQGPGPEGFVQFFRAFRGAFRI